MLFAIHVEIGALQSIERIPIQLVLNGNSDTHRRRGYLPILIRRKRVAIDGTDGG